MSWHFMSSKRVQGNNYYLQVYLDNISDTCIQKVFKIRIEGIFQTSWRPAKYLPIFTISVYNKSKSTSEKFWSNKSISDKSKVNSREIRYELIRTQ